MKIVSSGEVKEKFLLKHFKEEILFKSILKRKFFFYIKYRSNKDKLNLRLSSS